MAQHPDGVKEIVPHTHLHREVALFLDQWLPRVLSDEMRAGFEKLMRDLEIELRDQNDARTMMSLTLAERLVEHIAARSIEEWAEAHRSVETMENVLICAYNEWTTLEALRRMPVEKKH